MFRNLNKRIEEKVDDMRGQVEASARKHIVELILQILGDLKISSSNGYYFDRWRNDIDEISSKISRSIEGTARSYVSAELEGRINSAVNNKIKELNDRIDSEKFIDDIVERINKKQL